MKTLGTLGASIAAALGAAAGVACGSSGPVACGGCGCGGDGSLPRQTVDVPFAVCVDGGADASDDASAAGDAGGDGGACYATCAEACAAYSPAATCTGTSDEGGSLVAVCEVTVACAGRKLDGLEAPRVRAPSAYAAWLAEMAWLEAAAVRAFERLARELRFHGAPRALVRRAKQAARDEARHARVMARLARSEGARVPRLAVTREATRLRDLERIACENAVEGCVRETFGAAQAALGARDAARPELARAMGSIAPDELRHAALGWDVAAWAERRLSPEARLRVRAAREAAAAELLQSTRTAPRERAMAEALAERLWAA